jgi:hypothetical protein
MLPDLLVYSQNFLSFRLRLAALAKCSSGVTKLAVVQVQTLPM